MKKISVVVPCYNEQEALPFFYKEIVKVAEKMKDDVDFEFLFVNDGSKDETLQTLRDLSSIDKRVRYVSFSRNFGKEAAMYAGLENAKGDFVTVMDADLQDPPKLLIEMYKIITEEKYDCVATRRSNRKGEPPIRSFFARKFYKLINKMSKTEMVDGARDFRLMTRQMTDAVLSMKEYNRYSKGLFSFVGFDTKWLDYENVERVAGSTKWNFWKLLVYAIEGIIAFTTAPLAIAAILGVVLCLLSFVLIIAIILKTVLWGDPVDGWPSLVCIVSLLSGVQLLCTGIIGEYLARTYLETKGRPIYIIKETEKNKDK